jgi:hypothetical protein
MTVLVRSNEYTRRKQIFNFDFLLLLQHRQVEATSLNLLYQWPSQVYIHDLI